jgi:hypothetical protein
MSFAAAHKRNRKGNMLVLVVAVTVLIVLTLAFFAYNYVRFMFGQSEHVNALEAASLAAARDLSKVVIDDDYFGQVALSDYPPIGSDTKAGDNEPCPVFSVNTLLGTTRLDLIIAHELNNQTMIKLAKEDIKKARSAAKKLNQALIDAVNGSGNPHDIDGRPVNIYASALQTYKENLDRNTGTGKAVITSFKLSLGWIEGGAPTITDVPKPDSKGQVPGDRQQNGRYKAYVNVPAYGEDFYFAGVAERASLTDVVQWRSDDGVRLSSAVRAESSHEVKIEGATTEKKSAVIHSAACAIPPGNLDLYPPGQLCIAFPHGRVPDINTIRNILEDPQLKINPMPLYTPEGGDWPPGGGVTLSGPINIPGLGGGGMFPPYGSYSTTNGFELGFYDWLRSARTKPRIDAVVALVDKDLHTVPGVPAGGSYQAYTFTGCPNSENDPRLVALASGSSSAQSAYLNMTTLGDVWDLIPENATTLQGNQGGANTTTGGNQFNDAILQQFWDGLVLSNQTGMQAYNAAMAIINNPASTPQAVANAQTMLKRAKWVIHVSYAMSQNIKELSAVGIMRENGNPLTFKLNKKFKFDFSQAPPKPIWESGSNEHENVNFANLVPTGAQIASGDTVAQMNSGPGQNYWFEPSNFANNTSSFFIATVYQDSVAAGLPDPSGGGFAVGPPSSGGGGTSVGSNPNPPAGLNKAIHMRFKNDGTIQLSYGLTPFANIPISEAQIYGVAFGAKTTGQDNQVTWTAVLRDQVRKWGRTAGGQHAGQPPAGMPPDYANSPSFGGVPGTSPLSWNGTNFSLGAQSLNPQPRRNYMSGGLSVEWQFRNPLVLKCNQQQQQTGNGNQSGEVVPDIPADLL